MQGLPHPGGASVNGLLARIGREPNAITGLILAGVSLAVLFGWDLTSEQLAGIGAFLGAVVVAIRWLTTPAGEVVAQRKPGEATKAGPAAESGVEGIPTGTPVELVTGGNPPPQG